MRHSFIIYVLLPEVIQSFILDDCAMIDLSWPFEPDTVFWPGAPNYITDPCPADRKSKTSKLGLALPKEITNENKGNSPADFSTGEHGGTYIDAPAHFDPDAKHLAQLPVRQMIGEACVIDVTEACRRNRDYLVRIDDILLFERFYGSLNGCILILRTGWENKYADKQSYLGNKFVNDFGDAANLHFPGLSPEAAGWLTENRKIKAVGIDTASIDHGQSKDFRTHRILSAHNVYNLENMMNLKLLPTRGATIIVAPMKITDGTGGPTRIYAFGHREDDPCERKELPETPPPAPPTAAQTHPGITNGSNAANPLYLGSVSLMTSCALLTALLRRYAYAV